MLAKVSTTNKQGQVVIPSKMRAKLNITEDTPLKIFIQNNSICLQPINLDCDEENTRLSFPKKKNLKKFSFQGKSKQNLVNNIDQILY